MRRTHSRTIHHCTAACTEGHTRAHPAHNTHQHTCTPASPPVEMDGEATNKRSDSGQNRIQRAWTSSAASPTTCCSSSSASSPPNLPCGPPCSPGGGAPAGAASPSTSPSTAPSATGIANAWPQSPRSFHRTLGQPDALTSACSELQGPTQVRRVVLIPRPRSARGAQL